MKNKVRAQAALRELVEPCIHYKMKEKRENIFWLFDFKNKERKANNRSKSFWVFDLRREEQKEEIEKGEGRKTKTTRKLNENKWRKCFRVFEF